MAKSSQKKRKVKVEAFGEAYVFATFNNVIISLTNKNGEVFHGHQQVRWDLKGVRKILLMLHN